MNHSSRQVDRTNAQQTGVAPRKPSRIYAGNEPLAAIHPLVPLALLVSVIGVFRVQSFFAQHAYERFGSGPGIGYLEDSILWLFVGAAACALAIVFRWLRGRREWGDLPLGLGFCTCFNAYVWAGFVYIDSEGRIGAGILDMPFLGPVIFGVVSLLFSYTAIEWITRSRRADPRVVWLLMVPLVIGVGSTWVTMRLSRYGSFGSAADRLVIDDNSLRLPGDWFRHSSERLPGTDGQLVYALKGDRLVVAQAVQWVSGRLLAQRFADVDGNSAEPPRLTAPRGEHPAPIAVLPAALDAKRLWDIVRDIQQRDPQSEALRLWTWDKLTSARFAGFEDDKQWLTRSASLQFKLRATEPSLEVQLVRRDGQVAFVLEDESSDFESLLNALGRDAERTAKPQRARGAENVVPLPKLIVRVQDDVTLQEFVDAITSCYEEFYYLGWFDIVLDASPSASELSR